jgi:hypothetical protein
MIRHVTGGGRGAVRALGSSAGVMVKRDIKARAGLMRRSRTNVRVP